MAVPSELRQISDAVWELPVSWKHGMRVPARFYGTQELIERFDNGVFAQAANVATLPGIRRYSYCMPDGHWGYGFPIGGVAAFDPDEGVISPGGIGFDINCGMRLVATGLTYEEVKPHIQRLVDRLFERIPSGVGSTGFVKLTEDEFLAVAEQGARWCLRNGYALPEDLERTEEQGCMEGADAETVSHKAVQRGHSQIGTLGSGNHYLEVQVARQENIFHPEIAEAFGITLPDQVVVMYHCGSRGFGHQIATDYLHILLDVMERVYGIRIIDKELACAPFLSPEGQNYFSAMKCAVNMSFANRQVILHRVREVFSDVFGRSPDDLGIRQIYDVTHNTAKLEDHLVDGRVQRVLIHRKGSTRAFGPGMEGIPEAYMPWGQPVIIGGSMETGSYLLAGTKEGEQTFYSTAHGSGRVMSRHSARKKYQGRKLIRDMLAHGIYVRTASMRGLAEEAGGAYKDIDAVVRATELAGISTRVARFVPVGNIKG